MQISLGPGFFKTLLIRLEISKIQIVFAFDIIKQSLELLVIEKYVKIFIAANSVMKIATRANVKILLQLDDCTGKSAGRTFNP
jgi:hypothetical protein